MRKRTLSREIALKVLYARDISREDAKECLDKFLENSDDIEKSVKEFSDILVSGVSLNQEAIDSIISKYAANWELSRMATIDKNILRIASFELLFSEEVPPKVAINEAIEMAKKYGDKDSSKFVNGILDKINKTERKK